MANATVAKVVPTTSNKMYVTRLFCYSYNNVLSKSHICKHYLLFHHFNNKTIVRT